MARMNELQLQVQGELVEFIDVTVCNERNIVRKNSIFANLYCNNIVYIAIILSMSQLSLQLIYPFSNICISLIPSNINNIK